MYCNFTIICGFGSKFLPFEMIHIFSREIVTTEKHTGCSEVCLHHYIELAKIFSTIRE